MPQRRARPHLGQWLWYTFGGGLPSELKDWVLKDTTGRTWVLRVMLRSFIYLVIPGTLVMVFLPASTLIRLCCTFGGVAVAELYALAYSVETTEHRLLKAGFPRGHGEHTRRKRVYGADYNEND